MTVKHYTCPTCGYDKAVWHLSLDISRVKLCENCMPKFSNPNSRISGFELNHTRNRGVMRR